MGDWLGTGRVADHLREYRSFEDARIWARNLGLKSGAGWRHFCKSNGLPEDIPADPRKTYRNKGWVSMGDWLGTGRVADQLRKYRPFQQARTWVRKLALASEAEWLQLYRSGELPTDIPATPRKTYRDSGWISMGDWLGTRKQYRPFNEARAWARKQQLQSWVQWQQLARAETLPADIPSKPDNTYREQGWAGVGDWLGTGRRSNIRRQYRPFKQARAFVRLQRLGSQAEWTKFCKSGQLPTDIPTNPNSTYRDQGWVGMGGWLGTGRVATHLRKYRPFEQARRWARNLKLGSWAQWQLFCRTGKLPSDIPAKPDHVYRDRGWSSVGDWLGTNRVATRSRSR